MTDTISTRLAHFLSGLREEDLPPEVAAKARACLLNGFGIALAGLGTPYEPVARRAAAAMDGGTAEATLLGSGARGSITGAILANGALFHGRGQEDTCGAAHLGAVTIPLLIALVESGRAEARDIVPALVAGYEAGGVFEELFSGDTTPRGFRATTLYGVSAAAAAVSRLLRLPADRMRAALGNAAAFSGGILQSFVEGTDEWRYQVGVTAQLGWTAAELARAGSVSAVEGFEGAKGLTSAFAGRTVDAGTVTRKLGHDWQTLRVAFKPFPVCAFNQTPVTAALDLRERIAGRPIAAVEVRMNPYECGYAGMDRKGPFTSISGTLMSIPFCIAQTLLRGAPTMRMMETYDDHEINALEKRVELVPDPSIPTLGCAIEVRLATGEREHVDCRMTARDYAYDFETLRARLKAIAAQEGLPEASIDRLADYCAAPDRTPLRTLFDAFETARAAKTPPAGT